MGTWSEKRGRRLFCLAPYVTRVVIFVSHEREISLRSWRYCVGARLKFWRRSRVPKKGSRDEADYKGSVACRKCRRAVLHDITVLKQNRVYFTASILTVQWLAHTLHKIVTFVNLSALVSNAICHQVLCRSDRRVKLLITKSKE